MSAFLIADGKIIACGLNISGNLCINNHRSMIIDKFQECVYKNPATNELVNSIDPEEFVLVRQSIHRTVALDSTGCVWVCGTNRNGNLGIPEVKVSFFVKTYDGGVKDVAITNDYTIGIDEDNKLLFCGSNERIMFEYPELMNYNGDHFITIDVGFNLQQITGSMYGLIALDDDGYIYICGSDGDTNQDSNIKQFKLVHGSYRFKKIGFIYDKAMVLVALDFDGNVFITYPFKKEMNELVQLTHGDIYDNLSCGSSHFCVLNNQGEVTLFGLNNSSGQLGSDSGVQQMPNTKFLWSKPVIGSMIKQIMCENYMTTLLDVNNVLYATWSDENGHFTTGQDSTIHGFKKFMVNGYREVRLASDNKMKLDARFRTTKRAR